jgi:hypothetical protein
MKHPGYINVCLEEECRDKAHRQSEEDVIEWAESLTI